MIELLRFHVCEQSVEHELMFSDDDPLAPKPEEAKNIIESELLRAHDQVHPANLTVPLPPC